MALAPLALFAPQVAARETYTHLHLEYKGQNSSSWIPIKGEQTSALVCHSLKRHHYAYPEIYLEHININWRKGGKVSIINRRLATEKDLKDIFSPSENLRGLIPINPQGDRVLILEPKGKDIWRVSQSHYKAGIKYLQRHVLKVWGLTAN